MLIDSFMPHFSQPPPPAPQKRRVLIHWLQDPHIPIGLTQGPQGSRRQQVKECQRKTYQVILDSYIEKMLLLQSVANVDKILLL